MVVVSVSMLVGLVHAVQADEAITIVPRAGFTISALGDDLRNYSQVTGTWVDKDKDPAHQGDRPADALNTSEIDCYPAYKACFESAAFVQDNKYLNVDVTVWEIQSLTKTRLVASVSGACATTTLTIDLATREVTLIRQNGGNSDYQQCVKPLAVFKGQGLYTPRDHPLVWNLVSGEAATKLDSRFKK